MPYIKQEDRDALEPELGALLAKLPVATPAGTLNYVITRILIDHIQKVGICYDVLNEVDGILSSVGRELYRRVSAKYEDQKIFENGDVYPVENNH